MDTNPTRRRTGKKGPAQARAPERNDVFIELTRNFNEEFESRPMLRLTGNDRYLGQSTIELDIRAVVLGDRVHVVMHDGESYAEGSTLDNGYRIKRIDQNYILLEKPHPLATQEGSEDATTLAYFIFNRQ